MEGLELVVPESAVEEDVLLLVDDDPSSIDLLQRLLERHGYRVVSASTGEEGLELAERERPTLALLDVLLPGLDGYEVCKQLKASGSTRDCAVIFVSALTESKHKVRGLELGAVDYLSKPFDEDEVVARVDTHMTIQRLQRQLHQRKAELQRELHVARTLVEDARDRQDGLLEGGSYAVANLRTAIAEAAETDDPILLMSPGGAGEEAVSRAIHHLSPRGGRLFLHVDCLNLREADAAALFGEGQSAWKWELARDGSLYLDRVEGLSSDLLAELTERLKAQQRDQETGAPRVIVYLQRSGGSGSRMDLVDRLLAEVRWTTIRIPTLSERSDDIPELVNLFLQRKARRLGREIKGIAPESATRLQSCPWPGNIDELRSVLDCALMTSSGPWVEVDDALLETGRRLGSYELVERIGSGSMGEVWKAKHRVLIRPAAVKLIRSSQLTDPSRREHALRQFEREARATAALESLNTVRLFDFGVTDDGALYYVMELLHGLNLESLVLQYGPLSPARAVAFMEQACGSLAEAHDHGLMHRDIKPANLFTCRLGHRCDVLKVLDFGLVLDPVEHPQVEVGKGVILGTPAFIAPESCSGAPSQAGDIYSLGCTLFWLLTGKYVFDVEGVPNMVTAHMLRQPHAPSRVAEEAGIPHELDDLVMACLEKDPDDRPGSAQEVRDRLLRVPLDEPWTRSRASSWWKQFGSFVLAEPSSGDGTTWFS